MIKIYAVKLDFYFNKINELTKYTSPEKKERLKRFYKKEDSIRCLVSDILARYEICRSLRLKNNEIIFFNNENGKPLLKNNPGYHFNLSHSGDWVVCAVNERPIGIDVEKIHPIDLDIAKRFFSCTEYNDLMSKNDSMRLDFFYDLWTLKESYIKAIGKGLFVSLNSFYIKVINKNEIKIFDEKGNCLSFFLKQYDIDADYKLAVCSMDDVFPKGIIIKNMNDFYYDAVDFFR